MVQERNPNNSKNPMALLIAHALVEPDDKQLPDLSKISPRMAHPLTMLKALIEQIEVFTKQIKERQKWQVRRYVRQQAYLENRRITFYMSLKAKKETQEEKDKVIIPERYWDNESQINFIANRDSIIDEDKIDINDLFAMDFFLTYCHISRGKDGWLGELAQVLADSEITNKSPDDNMDRPEMRAT
ncbi:hypothetical protein M0R04_08140 [Candidatus Dojkabacteria bacterium]|jgi:hypothetical protein|nr:hypothetical protein [Candidatus Dojkabacteria bacterium]